MSTPGLKTGELRINTALLLLFISGILLLKGSDAAGELVISGPDTMCVPYTYWQPSGGPFSGLCGNPYSLVFTGTLTKLFEKTDHHATGLYGDAVLYTGQTGIVEIAEMKFKRPPEQGYKKLPGRNYMGEHFFLSDCFYGSRLKEGDKVMIFVYAYEGEYCIPGKSIIKIGDDNDPAVRSVETYLNNDQDPLAIRADTTLWSEYGYAGDLKRIIDCRLATMQDTLRAITEIKSMIKIGWGTKYNCEILEIKKGELLSIDSTFVMSFAIGAEQRYVGADMLLVGGRYLLEFAGSAVKMDKPYIPAGTNGLLDKKGIIWHLTKASKSD